MFSKILLLTLVSTILSLGVSNTRESQQMMNAVDVSIDWSGLLNNMQNQQQPQPQMQMQQQPQRPQQPQQPQLQGPPMQMQMQMQQAPAAPKVVAPEFLQVNSGSEIRIPNINTASDLIVRSWGNTWAMLSQDPNSSITIIYAGFKPLEGAEGVHWRIVFCIKGSANVEYVALDVAVLSNGTIDVFRNIQTRNLGDINLLFGHTIEHGVSISAEFLRESFLHNAPLALNAHYDAAQANSSGFNIEWTKVQTMPSMPVQQAPKAQENSLTMMLNSLGQQNTVTESNVAIGSSNENDDNYNFGW